MPKSSAPLDLKRSLLESYGVNERINQYLLENLDDAAWNAEPPGGKGRTIAAIVAHMHNVRHMWLVVSAKDKPLPEKIDRASVTRQEAMQALAQSAEACARMLAEGLEHAEGKVKGFRPDVVGMLGYLISHDAHHRGQIAALARQIGHPLPKAVTFGMWEWGARWKECGHADKIA
jgi:uncharacterized damage-inducible protein DinB